MSQPSQPQSEAAATPTTATESYRIYSWDHEADGWSLEHEAATPLKLRPMWRELRQRGYDDQASILILGPGREPA